MRPLNLLVRFFLSTLFLSLCLNLSAQAVSPEGEKINMTDAEGKRQGFWKITGAMSLEEGYRKNQVVEEGTYVDNKREGLWRKFYPTGAVRSEITFSNNHPRGEYKIFYPDGKIEEEGNWQANKNIGPFKRYFENGQIAQDFHFSSAGKRDGEQKYFYQNGQYRLVVQVSNGVANGSYKTFYSNGKLREEKIVKDGKVESTQFYPIDSAEEEYVQLDIPESIKVDTKTSPEDKTNIDPFKRSGHNTLYNQNKQITQVGEFKEGRLWNGKWHRYDSNGLLRKVEVYQDGKFVGYAAIEGENK